MLFRSTRVAVVIDPGAGTDAPTGEQPGPIRTACLSLPAKVTSADALKAAARSLRKDATVLCAIDGYPREECAPQIGGATPSFTGALPDDTTAATAAPSPSATAESAQRSSWAKVSPVLLGALGSLLLLGGAVLAFLQRPRR